MVFVTRRRAIFVNGCFWHGHDCKRGARPPKANAPYWRAKIAANQLRDLRVATELRAAGWKAMTVWECETRDQDALAARLIGFLVGREKPDAGSRPIFPPAPKVNHDDARELDPAGTSSAAWRETVRLLLKYASICFDLIVPA